MVETLAKPDRPWALRLLPPFPHVASRVIALVNDEDTGAKQISDVIRLDPSFTAEILRVANSALYGASREITTVALAVGRLGLDRVKACATMIALNSMLKPGLRAGALRQCWAHSLVTAVVTEELARVSSCSTGIGYTAGMLHDLGMLGLMAVYPQEYNRMLEVAREFGFDLIQTERELFEIDHCAAGACLAEEWNFPFEIGVALATHHEDPYAGKQTITSLVRIAWRVADLLGGAVFPDEQHRSFADLIERVPGIGRSWLGDGIDDAKREIARRLSGLPV